MKDIIKIDGPIRLDVLIAKFGAAATTAQAKRWINQGAALVNDWRVYVSADGGIRPHPYLSDVEYLVLIPGRHKIQVGKHWSMWVNIEEKKINNLSKHDGWPCNK